MRLSRSKVIPILISCSLLHFNKLPVASELLATACEILCNTRLHTSCLLSPFSLHQSLWPLASPSGMSHSFLNRDLCTHSSFCQETPFSQTNYANYADCVKYVNYVNYANYVLCVVGIQLKTNFFLVLTGKALKRASGSQGGGNTVFVTYTEVTSCVPT